jgi:hypothetical protein
VSYSSLLVFDPADNLIRVENQSAAGRGPEVRKPSREKGLSYGPRRAADQGGDLAEGERRAELRRAELPVKRAEAGAWRSKDWPRFAHKRPGLGRAMGRAGLPAPKGQKGP